LVFKDITGGDDGVGEVAEPPPPPPPHFNAAKAKPISTDAIKIFFISSSFWVSFLGRFTLRAILPLLTDLIFSRNKIEKPLTDI